MSNDAASQSGVRVPEFGHRRNFRSHTVSYLQHPIDKFLPAAAPGIRMLDIGCGNGFWAGEMVSRGFNVVGIDPSNEGIAIAREAYPSARFEVMEASSDPLPQLGEAPFDVVMSMEVIEHVYLPRIWASACYKALKPGGRLICSTPYHGYLKNLVLSLGNLWDRHASPLWDGGHIKLWSRQTLGYLLKEAGFVNLQFVGAGRYPYLWKSMVFAADRPR